MVTMRERDAHRHARYERYIMPGIAKEHTNIVRRHFLNNGRALLSELAYGSPVQFSREYQKLK